MVKLSESATGAFGLQVGTGERIQAGYTFLPNVYDKSNTVQNYDHYSNRYLARNLRTTDLAIGCNAFIPRVEQSYGIRGQVHQGQQRTGILAQYVLPPIKSAPNRSATVSSTDTRLSEMKLTKAIKSALSIPLLPDRTAGLSTLRTSSHRGGIGRWQASARCANNSIAKNLSLSNTAPQHFDDNAHAEDQPKLDNKHIPAHLVPYGHEDEHYTELEMLKKDRMRESYFENLQKHKKHRSNIIKRKMAIIQQLAEKQSRKEAVKERETTPQRKQTETPPKKIKINITIKLDDNEQPSAKQKTIKAPDHNLHVKKQNAMSVDKYYLKNPGLESAARAWKNIPKSYLNVWNKRLDSNFQG